MSIRLGTLSGCYPLYILIQLHPEILIDEEDLKEFGSCSANFDKDGYVNMTYKGETIHLHRAIMGFPDCDVDHKDGIVVNNKRENLRKATRSQNIANSGPRITNKSGYKGVSWCKVTKKWRAQIMVNRKTLFLGCYRTKEAAAESYNKASKKHFGEFAFQNKVGELSSV